MPKLWSYFLLLLWFCCLLASSLFLFIDGFFLTRVSRPEESHCNPPCPQARARVVLLVVDALKYDFLEWSPSLPSPNFHRNKVPIVQSLLSSQSSNARLFKSIADPPTTTLQRIKALTTGTLPTFIDISANFAAGSIDEDSIISQNEKNGIVFMGDDTWTSLFPARFLRQFPSPSFNVLDLDTVDRDVRTRIFFELQKKDWRLLIAHTLGVDHCGHKHGQNHPEMTRKLNETNELIKEIIEVLDDETVLFVIGDHGMTEGGDHGGDSPSEVEAAMFVYSKKPLEALNPLEEVKTVNQVDIVPTISMILGSPIPFSNIGAVIIEALPKLEDDHDREIMETISANVDQMKRYVDVYSSETFLFSEEKLKKIEEMYQTIKKFKQDEVDDFLKASREYFRFLRDSCVEIWVQFEANLMSQGLVLTFCILFFIYLILSGIPEEKLEKIVNSSFLKTCLIANITTSLGIFLLYFLAVIDNFKNINSLVCGIVSLSFLGILVIQNWDVISNTWYHDSKSKKNNYLVRVILGLTVCGLFSNSYVIHEDKVLAFLLVTLVWVLMYSIQEDPDVEKKQRKPLKSHHQRLILVLTCLAVCGTIRASGYFWRCREEQHDCTASILGKVGSMTSNNFERVLLIITLTAFAVFITVVRMWLKSCGNLSGFSPSTIVVRYCHPLMVVCMGSYWVLMRLPQDPRVKFAFAWQTNGFALVVYSCIILGLIVLILRPLMVFLMLRRDTIGISDGENVVPKLFDKMKEMFWKKPEPTVPVVYGLGTVYSSVFIAVSVFVVLGFALVLGNVLAGSTIMMVITAVGVLGLAAIEKIKAAGDIDELMHVSNTSIFCWFLIAEYFFYGTGHQPTFPTIYWDAAFVGTNGNSYGNIIPAVLIGINTFGSHIIMGLTLPLLIITPFTIFVMLPKLAKTKFRLDGDMKRGELILFDKESAFHSSLFTAYGKYVLFHGLRVFACMFAATVHCRHLMVWKIFAPKLIFECLSFLVTLGSVLTGFFLVIRIDNQVEELITRVTKAR